MNLIYPKRLTLFQKNSIRHVSLLDKYMVVNPRHAFVTWVIYDPIYIVGAMTLSSSLQKFCPGYQRICMISKDIETEVIKNQLSCIFDIVVSVDLIEVEVEYKKSKRFDKFYSPWIKYCFTRLQALRLGSLLGLERIILLDADTIILGDITQLFELDPPAGILSFKENDKLPNNEIFKHDNYHGKKYAIDSSYGIRGCLLLLRPSDVEFFKFIDELKVMSSLFPLVLGKYGNQDLQIGPDELLLSKAYQTKTEFSHWTHIHERHMLTAWWSCEKPILGLHYVSEKPWTTTGEHFSDYDIWYGEASHLCRRNSELFSSIFNKLNMPQNNKKNNPQKFRDPKYLMLYEFQSRMKSENKFHQLPHHSDY